MSIEFIKLDASTRQAFQRTLLTFWDQRWDEKFEQEFLDWRYARRTAGETLLAMSGSKCIGLIDTFIRPYRIGGQEILVREPCDWFCLPGNRGIGMRLLKFLIAQGEPLLGVGLPKAAIAMAPRLKWQHLAETRDFVLPITARRVVGAILRKAKLGDGSVSKYLSPAIKLRPNSTWTQPRQKEREVSQIGPDEWPVESFADVHASADYAVAPILTKDYVRWLTSGPEKLGLVFCLAFRIKGLLVGLTVCRLETSKIGHKAKIIHLQSSDVCLDVMKWMLAENVYRATQMRAESVHCRSSCPVTNAALKSLHFHTTASEAVMAGFNSVSIPTGPTNITFLRGDDAMIPSLISE